MGRGRQEDLFIGGEEVAQHPFENKKVTLKRGGVVKFDPGVARIVG